MKSLDDALKYVTKINKNVEGNKDSVYLSETSIAKLVKKCKELSVSSENVSGAENVTSASKKAIYSELISLVQRVFQSYKSLALSFTYGDSEKKIEISHSMPSIPPFNIDFNSLRRSYSLLFG